MSRTKTLVEWEGLSSSNILISAKWNKAKRKRCDDLIAITWKRAAPKRKIDLWVACEGTSPTKSIAKRQRKPAKGEREDDRG